LWVSVAVLVTIVIIGTLAVIHRINTLDRRVNCLDSWADATALYLEGPATPGYAPLPPRCGH